MGAAAARASLIINSRQQYCTYVVNEILFGRATGGPVWARNYLTWGSTAYGPAEGVVVVKSDGTHVGVFISQTEFVHLSDSQHKVVKLDKSQVSVVFGPDPVYRSEY